jgi:phage repressor protein C with HTH and peptisase S24 domain
MLGSATYDMEKKEIIAALEAAGKTRAALAAYLGVTPPTVTKMLNSKRPFRQEEIVKIRRFLLGEVSASYAPDAKPDVRRVDTSVEIPTRSTMPRDVPVYGTAWGGESGDFTMNGETGDYARRPARFLGRADLFALYVQGTSMEPRYFSGEMIFVEKDRPPQNGDHVVIELLPDESGVREAYLKVLIGRTPTKIRLRQYSPAKEIEIDRRKVGQILRVLTLIDLLGS